jgi:mRNA-degrading endonuclease RelE of RelBE toxin-antitoxin system
MPEYDVLLSDDADEFLTVADEKSARICREKLGYLAENPYPGRGDKEKLPIDGNRDRFRIHISRTYTAIYTVLEDRSEVRVLEILPIDEAHKRYGF